MCAFGQSNPGFHPTRSQTKLLNGRRAKNGNSWREKRHFGVMSAMKVGQLSASAAGVCATTTAPITAARSEYLPLTTDR